MKRLICIFMVFLLTCGCNGDDEIEKAIILRQKLLDGNGCSFLAEVTADYGDIIYQFSMDCRADKQGNVTFAVVAPESISGVTGTVCENGGRLTFDGSALVFAPIADDQVTPVTAPWLFLKTLRSGYIVSCANGSETTYIQINDSYADEALHMDIWLDNEDMPSRGEILWKGRRILSISVRNFTIL